MTNSPPTPVVVLPSPDRATALPTQPFLFETVRQTVLQLRYTALLPQLHHHPLVSTDSLTAMQQLVDIIPDVWPRLSETPSDCSRSPQEISQNVQLVSNTQLAAIIELALDLDPLQQDNALLIQAILARDRVIRELSQQTTILPLRLGTCFTALPGLLTHLEDHQQAYLHTLTQITDKVESTLKLTPKELPDLPIDTQFKGKD